MYATNRPVQTFVGLPGGGPIQYGGRQELKAIIPPAPYPPPDPKPQESPWPGGRRRKLPLGSERIAGVRQSGLEGPQDRRLSNTALKLGHASQVS